MFIHVFYLMTHQNRHLWRLPASACGNAIDVAAFEVGFQCVPVPLQRPSLGMVPLLQLSIEQHLWDSAVVHPPNMSLTTEVWL